MIIKRIMHKLPDISASSIIPASIEASPAQVLGPASLAGLFPQGVRVYLTDTGAASQVRLVDAARHLRDLGYEPVPHLAARRIPSRVEFEEQVKRLAGEAGVSDVLVVGGGVERPAGPFASSMDMLSSGIFDRYGMNQIAIAGHPEGSPDFSEETAVAALRLKRDFAQRSDATMRIVTQFGFDAARFIAWAEGLVASGIDLPVHIGVSGPAKITTLLKYAALCGVGNSIAYLKKNALSLTTLAKGHSPESVVGPIERHWQANPQGPIRQIHVFPFGGLQNSADWLVNRGSWQTGGADRSASPDSVAV
ncbi:methylenetetrahydrofolate reductase [Agrobacterium genomosp. 3 str. CIP 111-78]|uniref:Methylenetetrahydrofolate reductase n=1 Tax=Agrobacterium tumefaciens TaxID=358 RepID=A0AAE6EJP9_AGRTU|nr:MULTISPECIES: methylenetetrahydrofolate reductase [Agrobacterium tumefaciens complex]MCA2374492.1 methylenetetrahydrofolate reductase [Agrobacterium tomkonis CIP 111-78]QCL99926.1 methylenetetrahydrofolate reductase [Agrobacterium tumefaciens]